MIQPQVLQAKPVLQKTAWSVTTKLTLSNVNGVNHEPLIRLVYHNLLVRRQRSDLKPCDFVATCDDGDAISTCHVAAAESPHHAMGFGSL